MAGRKPNGRRVLDALVQRVSHVAMVNCRDEADFREALRALVENLKEVMGTLAGFPPRSARSRRAADNLKLKAVRLLDLCQAVPETFGDPDAWRDAAARIMANYEQFRNQAGHLYRLEVPGPGFDVLASAL